VLLNQGIKHLPVKLERATWLNYVRCHDDIGLGFDDNDVRLSGYDPVLHRRFLLDYFTGRFAGSAARGLPFGVNPKTGDARISGALASLAGLEVAQNDDDPEAIDAAIKTILMLHSLILAFGGIPLFYYGDAVGTLNSLAYLADPSKADDNRWVNRSYFDWQKAALRHQSGTVEQRIFSALKKMIAQRKELSAFADFDDRQLISVDNANLLVFLRTDLHNARSRVLVVSNFNTNAQRLPLDALRPYGLFQQEAMRELCSGERLTVENNAVMVPPLSCCWLVD